MYEKELLKEDLLNLCMVVDNEWLSKYVDLINSNIETKRIKCVTQRHHVIPKYYFKLNNIKVDNSVENIVNLTYKDHILAHYYLARCSSTPNYSYHNYVALNIICYKYDKSSIEELDLEYVQKEYARLMSKSSEFNVMFDPNIKAKHDAKMRSEEVSSKISNTMKQKAMNGELFSEEHRKNLVASMIGTIYVNKNGVYTRITCDKLNEYLNDGWVRGNRPITEEHKQALINSHLGKKYSLELRKKLSDAHMGKSPANKGTKMMTNGKIVKYAKPEDFDKYLENGFWFSAKSKNKGGDSNE